MGMISGSSRVFGIIAVSLQQAIRKEDKDAPAIGDVDSVEYMVMPCR
jgi:hypothetical protein